MATAKKVYRVELDGKTGFYITVSRKTPEKIKKDTQGIYPRQEVTVHFEQDMTPADAKAKNDAIIMHSIG